MKYIYFIVAFLAITLNAKTNFIVTSNFYNRDGSFDIIITFDEPYTDNIIYAKNENIATIKLNNVNLLKNKNEQYNNNFLNKIKLENKNKNAYINIQLRKNRDINIVQTEDKYGLKVSIIKLSNDSIKEMPMKFNDTKGISIVNMGDKSILEGQESAYKAIVDRSKTDKLQVVSKDIIVKPKELPKNMATPIRRNTNDASINSNQRVDNIDNKAIKSEDNLSNYNNNENIIPTSSYIVSGIIVLIGLMVLYILNRKKPKSGDYGWLSNLQQNDKVKRSLSKKLKKSETNNAIDSDGIEEVIYDNHKYIIYNGPNGSSTVLEKTPYKKSINELNNDYQMKRKSRSGGSDFSKNMKYADIVLRGDK